MVASRMRNIEVKNAMALDVSRRRLIDIHAK